MLNALLCLASLGLGMTPMQAEIRSVTQRTKNSAPAFTLALEAGYNGLAGTGLNVSYHFTEHFSLDGGLGVGMMGIKTGLRTRYNFVGASPFTPFIAAGVLINFGTQQRVMSWPADGGPLPARYIMGVSPYAQIVCGLVLIDSNGFTVMGSVGWAHLLRAKNFAWSAAPLPAQRAYLPTLMGSGPVASVAAGYSF